MRAAIALMGALISGAVLAQEPSEELQLAVDRALAMTLIDPTEVIDYEVGGLVDCGALTGRASGDGQDCVCYAFNSRNRMGGYAGKTLRYGVAGQLSDGQFIVMDAGEVRSRSGGTLCANSGIVKRDGQRIADQID